MKVEYIGLIGGFFTTFCFVPQVWKTVKTNNTKGISLIYFGMVNIGITLWFVYGVAKSDIAIILANFFSLIFAFVIFSYKLRNVICGKENI
jgi:MtN3 and saliva related transmembrane protein